MTLFLMATERAVFCDNEPLKMLVSLIRMLLGQVLLLFLVKEAASSSTRKHCESVFWLGSFEGMM